MHRIIILAGGGARKGWTYEHPKPMAVVEDKPIVLRMVLQVKKRNCEPIVQTHYLRVIEAVGRECACYWPGPWGPEVRPRYHEYAIGGVFDSMFLWNKDGRTTLLCGDAVYPPEVLDGILKDESPISVWGTGDEIFAITFSPGGAIRLTDTMDAVMHQDCIGHLWGIYRVLCGFPIVGHRFEDVIFKRLKREPNLVDFDSVEGYERWLKSSQK